MTDYVKEEYLAMCREIRELKDVIRGLKNSECWCGVGIGDPRLRGEHTPQCKAAQEAMEKATP